MAYYTGQKTLQEFRKAEKEVIGGLCSLSNIPLTPESQRDHDRRIRREIANSNERRRMQSINAGFQSLKVLLPHTDGEKLSKAAILQQTADFIFALEEDKARLMQQNAQLKRLVQEYAGSSPKRKRGDESDEGIGSPDSADEELAELRQHLEKERLMRVTLEEKVKTLESQFQPEKVTEILQCGGEEQEGAPEYHKSLLEEQHGTVGMAQLCIAHSPPAPTHHPTVIVPAPLPASVLQLNMLTMAPSSVISTVSTSKQNLDTIVQAIQHIEATEQGVKEEPERLPKQTRAFLELDRMQEGIKEEREWHGLVTASPLIIKSSFGDAVSGSQDAERRELLAALRPKVEVEPIPSLLLPAASIL